MAKKNRKVYQKIDLGKLSNQAQTLLANIRFASVDEPVKTVCVTSSNIDEGKSTTVVSLAMAMAKAGKRTLLIDCDMRRRSLARMMDMHPEHGIYAVLAGEASLKNAVVPTGTKNLYFLDCEPNIVNPSDLLATKRFAALLGTVKNAFDYVVIDTPPMQLFVDAAVVAALCDGTLFVIRQRQAKKREVADSLVQLQAANARVLGSVLTFAQKGDNDYYYYYAYYNEENKRVKHRHTDENGFETEAPASKREFDEGDMDAWAKSVGVNAAAGDAQAPKASRHAAAPARDTKSSNPYAPGAFKK